jgi:hypothetical protein
VIGAYDHSEKEMEVCYEAVEEVMGKTPKDNVKFLVGTWNDKKDMGISQWDGEWTKIC